MLLYSLWFVLGLLAVWPLLAVANKLPFGTMHLLLGQSLVVAAVIYLVFALLWGDMDWVVIELLGVGAYGVFYVLSRRLSIFWLAAGWLLHPLWDVLLHLKGPGQDVVPDWYAVACLSFDVAVASYIVWREMNRQKLLNSSSH